MECDCFTAHHELSEVVDVVDQGSGRVTCADDGLDLFNGSTHSRRYLVCAVDLSNRLDHFGL